MAEESAQMWLAPEDDEEILRDPAEQYLRQCHPSFIQNGIPTSQLFLESSGDDGKISGSRGHKATAEAAFLFRTEVVGGDSAGTWAVTVQEAWESGVRVVDDSSSASGPPAPAPPGHAYLDYRMVGTRAKRRVRGELIIRARNRGRQHPRAK